MPTTPTSTNNPPLRRLSAEAFINALKGETVIDENGTEVCFLQEVYQYGEDYPDYSEEYILASYIDIIEEVRIDEDYTFKYPIELIECSSSRGLSIILGVFEQEFKISKGTRCRNFHIQGGHFHEWFNLKSGEIDSFSINGGEFHNGFVVGNPSIETFTISGGHFHQWFSLNGEGVFKDFKIQGGIFKKAFRVINGDFTGLRISAGAFNIIIIDGGNFHKLKITETNKVAGSIGSLFLNSRVNYDIEVADCHFTQLKIAGRIDPNGNVKFSNVHLSHLLIEDFLSLGKLVFSGMYSHVNENSTLLIRNSNLGELTCFDVDFSSFDKLIIDQVRASEIITNYKHFPVSSEQPIYTSEDNQEPHKIEEVYNQLYLAMQKQGNRTQEIKYYAEYLEWHRKSKLAEFGSLWKLSSYLKKDWYTPASLWLHKFSSGYGNNWVRSAVLTLLVTALCYYCYTLSLPEIEFGFDGLTWDYFGSHFKYYTQFILPTHGFQLIPNTDTSGWPAFWDFFGRIVSGFLIYQTIAAFRRFGKR